MISPAGLEGVVFTESSDGDQRSDPAARSRVCAQLGIPLEWATVRQMHASTVKQVSHPGLAGQADALWTTSRNLPLAVFTADCYGVVMLADRAVGVAHAGWRGAATGVVSGLRAEMELAGHRPTAAALGPGIGACCFEVGEEVAARFEGRRARTRWDTGSVDLAGAIVDQLAGISLWRAEICTMHEQGWFSHRENGTAERLASIAWLP